MGGSISSWIEDLRTGRASAGEKLWARYYSRMLRLARTRLPQATRRVADEDDIAVSAFASFLRGISNGLFPQLSGRAELWKLLAQITVMKSREQVRNLNRLKRATHRTCVDADQVLAELADPSMQPAAAALINDSLQFLLELLDEEMRDIAVAKLRGHTNQEVADQLNRSLPTIERRLRLIRRIWSRELPV